MLERKGNQFRLRIRNPKLFQKKSIRTVDVGDKGGLKVITGKLKGRKTTTIQALRLSINDFKQVGKKLRPVTNRGKKELSAIRNVKSGPIPKRVKEYFYGR